MNLVKIKNGQPVVSSRQIAEDFGKEHKHVKESIKDIMRYAENSAHLFYESTYKDSMNRTQVEYLMNRDGFTLLAMGFTGKPAMQWKMKYIQAFNQMEQQLVQQVPSLPKDYLSALKALVVTEEAKQLAESKVTEMLPKANFVDEYVDKNLTYSIREAAKIFDIPERKFISILFSMEVVFRQSGKILPYARRQSQGYFEVKIGSTDRYNYEQTRFTTKGMYWIAKKIKGIIDPNWEENL